MEMDVNPTRQINKCSAKNGYLLKTIFAAALGIAFTVQAQEDKTVFERNFKLPLSWKSSENAALQTIEDKDGGTYISLQSSDKKNCSIWTSLPSLEKGISYELKLSYRNTQPGKNSIMVKYNENGKKNMINNEIPVSADWKDFKTVLHYTGDSRARISINGCDMLLKKLSIRRVTEPDNTIRAGKNTYQFISRQKSPDPASLLSETDKPVFYKRAPRMVYPESIPQDYEQINELSAFSVPGEYACWNFVIYVPEEKFKVKNIRVPKLTSKNGEIIRGENIKISYVRFWKKPTLSHNSYSVIPELILPFNSQAGQEGRNRIFWFQTRLPENMKHGIYKGEMQIETDSGTFRLPVRLNVLPFKLITPPSDKMVWSAYARMHTLPQRSYPAELKLKYLRDMKDYGVTSLVHTASSENSIKEIQELRTATGMDGPLVIKSTFGRETIEKFTGKTLSEAKDSPGILKDFIIPLQNMDQWMKKYGTGKYTEWYFFETDEPHCGDRMPHAMLEIRLIKSAGVGTAYPVYPYDAIKSMGPYLDISINSFIANNETSLRRYMELAEKYNLKYWYLGGGAYMGQDGGLMPNRLLSGMLSFKSGVNGHVSYTYQNYATELRKDPLDNFTDGRSYGMTCPAPDSSPEKVTLSTLEWEGIREGITDYKYLYTLRFYISEAEKKGFSRQAEEGKKALSEILGYIPWGDDYKTGDYLFDSGNFTDDKAVKLRCMAAQEIIKLKEVMK